MVRLDEVFEIWYGVNLEVVNCEVVEKGMPFVSRQSTNNGVNCYVKEIEDITPNPANTLSIAVSGSVLSTYFHEYEYYSGRDVYIAKPKLPFTKMEMLFYCKILEANKYRYNYGRAANRTLRNILVPLPDEIPLEIKNLSIETNLEEKSFSPQKLSLADREWAWFNVGNIFDCKTTKHAIQQEMISGNTNFVTRSALNNGVSDYIDSEGLNVYDGNCITIGAEGITAFYQPDEFVAGVKVYTLTHQVINKYNAMFIITLLNLEKYRYNYGNARILEKIKKEKIKLPITPTGDPDFQFMEDYIKSLPYSGGL